MTTSVTFSESRTVPVLPGTPPPVLQAAYDALEVGDKEALVGIVTGVHISAERLSYALTVELNLPVSASTIRTYRRALRQEASVKV